MLDLFELNSLQTVIVVAILLLLLIAFIYKLVKKEKIYTEKEYQIYFAKKMNGKIEIGLPDNDGRIDIVLKDYVIEAKRLSNSAFWGCVGQALFYSIKTDKKPGVLAIIENDLDYKQLEKLKIVCLNYNIKLWTIDKTMKIKQLN